MTDVPYDKIADEWESARVLISPRECRYLDILLEGLPERSTVLDLGCGTGRPIAEYVAGKGHHIVGVDRSRELLSRARRRLPDAEFVEARMEEYPFVRPVAAVVCWDAMFHVERSYHEQIIRGVARSLPEGGRFMLSTGGSAHPPFTDTMFGHSFYYDSYPPDEAVAIVERAGFTILVAEFTDLPTEGRDKGKFAIVARLGSHEVI